MPLNPKGNQPNKAVSDTNANGIPFSTETPNSDTKGMILIKYTEASDTTMTLYVRHPKTGTWRSATLS